MGYLQGRKRCWFPNDVGNQDESYLYARVDMFEQALMVIFQLPTGDRDAL
jgi:hypothetical protein